VALTPGAAAGEAAGSLDLTAEALLRLVYGRIGDSGESTGEVRASNVNLDGLKVVFPGF
jgi:hypothetical protein